MSQKGKADRDLIQVGHDYIRNIQINILNGNFGTLFVSLILLILALFILGSGVKYVSDSNNVSDNVSNKSTLNQGQVNIQRSNNRLSVPSTVSMIASTEASNDYYANVYLRKIPLSAYEGGKIKLGENNQSEGRISIYDKSKGGSKEYQVNSESTDLMIELEANPTDIGKFAKGKLSGTVTDGIEKRKVSFNFVLPIQK